LETIQTQLDLLLDSIQNIQGECSSHCLNQTTKNFTELLHFQMMTVRMSPRCLMYLKQGAFQNQMSFMYSTNVHKKFEIVLNTSLLVLSSSWIIVSRYGNLKDSLIRVKLVSGVNEELL